MHYKSTDCSLIRVKADLGLRRLLTHRTDRQAIQRIRSRPNILPGDCGDIDAAGDDGARPPKMNYAQTCC